MILTFSPKKATDLFLYLFGFLLTGNYLAIVQSPPNTDVYFVELDLESQPVKVGSPVNITHRFGYDNQPSFTPDGKSLLYTSMREDGQTDIYRYDLKEKTATQLTHTTESEYSPIVTPDRAYFSVIRVEKDKTQRLWKFPVSGAGEPKLVLEQVKPVGYHCWLTNDWLALFILGKPNSLQLAKVSTGDTLRIEGNIGRGLQKVPGKNAVTYIYKRTPTEWDIMQLDLQTRRSASVVKTLEGSEDFVWTPDGTILMCQGAILYQYKPNQSPAWTKLADLSSFGINQLTRLAIDPKGKLLALVGQ